MFERMPRGQRVPCVEFAPRAHTDGLRAAAMGAPPLRYRRTRQDGSRHARHRTIRTGSSVIACANPQTAQAVSYVIRLRSTRSAIFGIGISIAHWSSRTHETIWSYRLV